MSESRGFLSAVLVLAVCGSAQAQEEPPPPVVTKLPAQVKLGGTLQPRVTVVRDFNDDTDRIGFGVRRLRGRAYVKATEHIGGFMQLEGAGAGAVLLDTRLELYLAERFSVRAGRFIGAQPRGFGRTSHYDIDIIDRPVIMVDWAKRTVGADGRDFGVEALLKSQEVELRGFLHNGDGSWDRARGNLREDPSTGSMTRGTQNLGVASSVSFSYMPRAVPGLDVGGFVGANFNEAPPTAIEEQGRQYLSYSAHAYWGALPGSQPVRVKADFVSTRYASVMLEDGSDLSQQVLGGSLLLAVSPVRATELLLRGEVLNDSLSEKSEDHQTHFLAAGVSFSPAVLEGAEFRQGRLTLAYTGRFDVDFEQTGYNVTLQGQIAF